MPKQDNEIVEAVKVAVREEIVRQYRVNERAECPAGSFFYEEEISPWKIARAAIAAHVAALEAAGIAIAPMEPTKEMLIAARDWSISKYGRGVGDSDATGCWRAMIAARPDKP